METNTQNIRKIRLINHIKLCIIGLVAPYIDGGPYGILKLTTKQKEKVPFSKNYNTYQDYQNELKKVEKYVDEDKEIPFELVKSLGDTLEELSLTDKEFPISTLYERLDKTSKLIAS